MITGNLKIDLAASVNGVAFKADALTVKSTFGKPNRSIKKAFFSKSRTDVYEDFHIYYSEKGLFEAIEVFGDVTVTVNGKTVFPGTLSQAKKVIPGLEGEHEEYMSYKASVGITTAEDETSISAMLFGCAGYYPGKK